MTTLRRPLMLFSLAATAMLVLSACGNSGHDHPAAVPAPAASTAVATHPPKPAPTPAPATGATVSTSAPAAASTTVAPAPAGRSAPAPASTAATAAATATDEPFAVTRVTVGLRNNAAPPVIVTADTIPPDQKAIYARVETRGKTDGATLGARWSYREGKGRLVSAISQAIATDGPAVTTFKIQNPHAWPAGKYKVDITLDGKPVSSHAFEVKPSG